MSHSIERFGFGRVVLSFSLDWLLSLDIEHFKCCSHWFICRFPPSIASNCPFFSQSLAYLGIAIQSGVGVSSSGRSIRSSSSPSRRPNFRCIQGILVRYVAKMLHSVISRRRAGSLALYQIFFVLVVFRQLCKWNWPENFSNPFQTQKFKPSILDVLWMIVSIKSQKLHL